MNTIMLMLFYTDVKLYFLEFKTQQHYEDWQ